MDKEKLWKTYLEKNPHWAKEAVHLTPKGLKKFVEQVWLHGYQHGAKHTKVRVE